MRYEGDQPGLNLAQRYELHEAQMAEARLGRHLRGQQGQSTSVAVDGDMHRRQAVLLDVPDQHRRQSLLPLHLKAHGRPRQGRQEFQGQHDPDARWREVLDLRGVGQAHEALWLQDLHLRSVLHEI